MTATPSTIAVGLHRERRHGQFAGLDVELVHGGWVFAERVHRSYDRGQSAFRARIRRSNTVRRRRTTIRSYRAARREPRARRPPHTRQRSWVGVRHRTESLWRLHDGIVEATQYGDEPTIGSEASCETSPPRSTRSATPSTMRHIGRGVSHGEVFVSFIQFGDELSRLCPDDRTTTVGIDRAADCVWRRVASLRRRRPTVFRRRRRSGPAASSATSLPVRWRYRS